MIEIDESKYDTLAELGVNAEEIQRIRIVDIRQADIATPVPDGGDAHEHQLAKQVDVTPDAGINDDGVTVESTVTPIHDELAGVDPQ